MSLFINSHSNCNSITFKGILADFINYVPKEDPIFNENYLNFKIYNYCIIDNNCPICLNIIKKSINLSKCGHTFCKQCIHKWLKYSKSCPICRTKI